MKKFIFIILLSVLMTGCGVKKKITHIEKSDSTTTVTDSSNYIYKEVIRDTTIYLPADSAYIVALLECDSMGEVRIKEIIDLKSGKNITPSIKIVENVIRIGCTTEDSVAISIYWKDIYESKYKEYVSNIEVNTSVEDEKIIVRSPWWLRFWWIWIVLAGVLFIGIKYFKKFF